MADQLYNQQILRLAADGGLAARLAPAAGTADGTAAGTAVKVSPICGSRVTADIRLTPQGKISAHGQEVRACALGQAAATLVAQNIIGTDETTLIAARTQLADWLSGISDQAPDWPGMHVFAPARPHRARHPSILLAFDAAIAATKAAKA